MADDKDNLEEDKKAPKEKKSKESVEYTSKMWNRIEKSASSKKRKGMKKRVENKKNMNEMKDNLNKKKKEDKKPKEKVEKPINKPKNTEKEVTKTAPVNPFSGSSLPPQEYEDRYHDMEASEEGDLAPSMAKGEVIIGEIESDVVDQGSKEDKVSDKGLLKTKSLDEKPLEEVKEAGKESINVEEEEKTASEMHQSNEKAVKSSEVKNNEAAPVEEVTEVEVVSKVQKESEIKGNLEADVFPTAENLKGKKDEKGFKTELWDILEQAGLTKKRLFGCLSIVLIAVLAFFSFSFFNGDDDKEVLVEEDNMGNFLINIVTSYIFGAQDSGHFSTNASDTSALSTAFFYGDTSGDLRNEFVVYLNLVSRMKNIYNTDLYEYLDKFANRSQALNNHLNELGNIISEAENTVANLTTELKGMQNRYDTMINTKNLHENEFFKFINDLNGSRAYSELQIFLEYSRYSSEIKADFNAKKTILNMINNVLEFLKPRYEDISLNKEALIEGIHVIDVKGSDIDIFIKEN